MYIYFQNDRSHLQMQSQSCHNSRVFIRFTKTPSQACIPVMRLPYWVIRCHIGLSDSQLCSQNMWMLLRLSIPRHLCENNHLLCYPFSNVRLCFSRLCFADRWASGKWRGRQYLHGKWSRSLSRTVGAHWWTGMLCTVIPAKFCNLCIMTYNIMTAYSITY